MRTLSKIALLRCMLLCVVLHASFLKAQSTDIAVVVNLKNPVNGLTMVELRKILSAEKRTWTGGVPVVIIVRSSPSHERQTLLHLLHMSESDYKQYWRAQVFRGEASAEPIAVPSNGMQREARAVYSGGIALVEVQDVKQGMKVLSLDGHLPGNDPDLPLEMKLQAKHAQEKNVYVRVLQYFTIAANDLGSRLAPPTSAPSISSSAIRALALSGFTDPP